MRKDEKAIFTRIDTSPKTKTLSVSIARTNPPDTLLINGAGGGI